MHINTKMQLIAVLHKSNKHAIKIVIKSKLKKIWWKNKKIV